MSSNYLAFGDLGVIVSYEIKSDTYWQCGKEQSEWDFIALGRTQELCNLQLF